MIDKREKYLDLASELLEVGQEFCLRKDNLSAVVSLGSKSVKVTLPDRARHDHIDVLKGMFDINHCDYPDYGIVFMDSVSTGYTPNTKNLDPYDYPLGQVRSKFTAPFRMALDIHTGTVSVHDPRSGVVVVWRNDVTQYPYWAAATPFRLSFAWLADTFDGEMLHGAVLVRDQKALVMSGPSGAGKSTSSFIASSNGFEILSDDFFLFEKGRFYPVYRRGKLHDSSLELLKEFRMKIINSDSINQKRIIELNYQNEKEILNGVEAKAFIIPDSQIMNGFEEAGSGAVLRNLAPYSISGILGGVERSLLRTKRAILNVPAYKLNLKQNEVALMNDLESIWDRHE
jgi:hypothetical protein